MHEKIMNVLKDKNLYIFFLITMVFFGSFCLMQYAPDTYSVFVNNTKETVIHFFSCGRFITGFVFYIIKEIFNFNTTIIYALSYMTAIACTTLSLYKLYKLLKRDIKDNLLCIIISVLIIINPFSIELFVYIEKGILMFSVLMSILAIEKGIEFLEGDKKSSIFAIIYMFLANCSYQGTVGIFVAISLIYIIRYSKNIKQFLINNIFIALFYGIPAIINLLLIKLFYSNNRVKGTVILSESFNKIKYGIVDIFKNNYGLLPRYLFSILIVISFIFIVYVCIKSKKKIKQIFTYILEASYLICGTIIVTIAPQIFQNTESIWFVARSTYPIASIIGIILLYISINFELNKMTKNIIIFTMILFLLIQFIYFMKYIIGGYIVDYEDRQNVSRIIEKINNYEKTTGIEITKISFYTDNNSNYTYSSIKSTGDINIKALRPEWSAIKIIEFYSGKHLEETEKDNEIEKKFQSINWDYYDDNQIEIVGDTIHFCNY